MVKKDDLVKSKREVDQLDIDKLAELNPVDLKPVLTNLSKLSDLVKKNFVEKTQYVELVNKLNATDTSNLVNKRYYNSKIKDIEDEVPSVTNLTTTASLTAVKNTIPSLDNLHHKIKSNNL